MGRKNYESIPEKYRPLPNRENVILTRNKDFKAEGCIVLHSIDELLQHYENEEDRTMFIIGGGEIYNQTMSMTDTIYRTVVNTEIDGDVYFSEINRNEFNLVWEETHEADEKNKFDYTYQKFERISLM